jgi:hypothetical protein
MHELRGVGVRGEEGDAWIIHELRGVGVRGDEEDAWLIHELLLYCKIYSSVFMLYLLSI